jgi:hypothetical protein
MNQHRSIVAILPVLIIIFALMGGCTNQDTGSTLAPTPTPGLPPATPTLQIVSPLEREFPYPADITIMAEVDNFVLVDISGQPNVPGEGHLIFYRDVAVPTEPGKPAITAEGTYVVRAVNAFNWESMDIGTHNFSVQLVNNDVTPLDPPVYATINISVMER